MALPLYLITSLLVCRLQAEPAAPTERLVDVCMRLGHAEWRQPASRLLQSDVLQQLQVRHLFELYKWAETQLPDDSLLSYVDAECLQVRFPRAAVPQNRCMLHST